MKSLLMLLFATATATAAPACPRHKLVPVELPAVGCPTKVELVGCDRCERNTIGISLTYSSPDGSLGAWREAFENGGWKVTLHPNALVTRKGHDRATITFEVHGGKRFVYLAFIPG